ncbi:hypothetical protein [Klebsiella pneumoniae]|uniref:hypothetical protein n=1 Tax=Klebsiella pneumoniae TaxID=573 RepID=UPI003A9231CC
MDSSVTAMLLHRAIGKNLTCVFVDNGLLRLNEAQQVMEMFGDHFGLNIVHVEGEQRFLDALAGESDPEAKRKNYRSRVRGSVRRRSAEAGRRQMAGAGYHLP